MQYCKRCKVRILHPVRRCPLCQGVLDGEPEAGSELFPDTKQEHSREELGFKIFSFLCIALVVLGMAGNVLSGSKIWWALYVMAAVGSIWLLTAAAFLKRRNLMKSTLWEMVLLWGIFLFWDFITGFAGWSLAYGLPLTVLIVYPVLFFIIIFTRVPLSYYMIYLILAGMAGLVPAVLLACVELRSRIPSVLCSAVSILVLAGLGVFRGKEFLEEIKKKTHL